MLIKSSVMAIGSEVNSMLGFASWWLAVCTGVELVAAAIGGTLGGVQGLILEWLLVVAVQVALVMRPVLHAAEMGRWVRQWRLKTWILA